MINLTDIRERLSNNPEPIEVTKIREDILNNFKNLEFIEKGHIYNLYNKDGTVIEKIPSASAIIERFTPIQDWDEIANQYALKRDLKVEDVQRKWHENNLKATNNGSIVHLYGENLQKLITDGNPDNICDVIKPQYEDGYLIPYGNKQEAILHYWEELIGIDTVYPLLPECKMYMPSDNKFNIKEVFCGTGDTTLLFKRKGEWCIILTDYKTNVSLINEYNRSNDIFMLPPFDDMIDESLSHYTIQLSLYSMMLENIGYKVIDRRLIWLKDDATYEKISLPYIKDKIISSFNQNV